MFILVYLVSEWETYHRRPMLEALARQVGSNGVVVCCNPVCSLPEALSQWRSARTQELQPFRDLDQVAPNLYALTPCIWLPVARRWKQRGSLGWRLVSRQVRGAIARLRAPRAKTIAWVYRPEQLPYLGLAREDYVVYECYDEYTLSPRDGQPLPGVREQEDVVLTAADLVFTTSQALLESRQRRHPNVHYAPNGVDFERFAANYASDSRPASGSGDIAGTVVGYAGSITESLDLRLLELIARSGKRESLVLLGPVDQRLEKHLHALQEQDNVTFLGRKQRADLPCYLKDFDAGIIPYKRHEYNHCRNPLKLYEYMASGVPVVAIGFDLDDQMSDIVRMADSREGFLAQLQLAIEEDNTERIDKGRRMARAHSWDLLTSKMASHLQKLYST